MAISSINFAKSSGGSFAHNDRTEKEPAYLLPVEHRLENECNRSALEAQKTLEELFENAKENYQKTYRQKFQTKFENVHWEAVINLNKEHTMKDVERLVREIEKETGFTAVQISVHRDEGRLNEKTRHPIYNLHAHVNFFTLDKETGRQLYRRSISNSEREKIRKEHGIPDGEKIPKHLTAVMDKEKLSKLQDITARELGMERGERGSTKVRLGHKQYRATEQEKEKLLEKIDVEQEKTNKIKERWADDKKSATELARELGIIAKENPKNYAVVSLIPIIKAKYQEDRKQYIAQGGHSKADYDALKKERDELIEQIKKSQEQEKSTKRKSQEQKIELEAERDALKTEQEHIKNQEAELEKIDQLYGEIVGLIESGANNQELKELLQLHEPYKPKRTAYINAKTRAVTAYKSKLIKKQPAETLLVSREQEQLDNSWVLKL